MAEQPQTDPASPRPRSLADRIERDLDLVDQLVARDLMSTPESGSTSANPPAAAAVELRRRLLELADSDPLAAERLGLRALEVLCCEEATEPGVRRPLAVAFSDLEGFTKFTYERGDAAAMALLSEHYETIDRIVDGHSGVVVKRIGDGHMMSFDTPEAAVPAAVETAQAAPGPLPTRVGVHYGLVVNTDGDLFGHVVNLAARVTEMAPGGASLVTSDIHDAVGDQPGYVYGPPIDLRVRGIEDAVTVYRVRAA